MAFPTLYNNDCVYISCSTENDFCTPASATTTDGVTYVTLLNITESINITGRIIAADGTNSWAFDTFVKAKNDAGIITVQPPIITRIGDNIIPDVRYIAGAAIVIAQVRGIAATTINWTSVHCGLTV